jgi:hypothetical protein
VHHGVLSRVALNENINIYSMGSYEILFNKINQDFPFHIKDYRSYKNLFDKLNDNFKNEIIQKSKKLLEDRFEGINDSAIFYMKNNAYSKNETDKARIFQDNKKKRVIIYMHDFYDSPHVRRWMLFPDFYEWLIFILSSVNTKEFDYYIKIHPNSNPKTVEIINNILSQLNTPVILLDKNVTSKQLIEEGFNYAITNHGTIAHELPYFNIRVLNSGDNPHINFSFSYTVSSKDEFKKIIQNPTLLDILIKPIDFKDEILRFYSMHNLVSNTSDKISIEENVYINSQIRFIESELQLQQFNTKKQSSEYLESIKLPFSKFTNHLFNA